MRLDRGYWPRRHSGARLLARARNPFIHRRCSPMDSGLARRAPRNDETGQGVCPGTSGFAPKPEIAKHNRHRRLLTQLRYRRQLPSRVLRSGPRRLFARRGCLVVDRDARRTQPGQQDSSYRGGIKSNILGVWWMCLAVLQSERQVQLLAKVLNDAIDLIVSHRWLPPATFCSTR
ncbi:hypothetical protein DXU04_26270 [Bradyrhizobium diazoefficiens]